jgi:protein-disulfide isomerase
MSRKILPRLTRAVPLSVVFLVFLGACSTAAQQAKPQAATDVVATVGSVSITLSEVDEKALQQPAGNFGNLKLSLALYEARRSAIDEIVGEKLLAQESKARGVTSAALTDLEIGAKVAAVTEADVTAWYDANPSRVQGAKLDQVRAPIRSLLTQERTQVAYQTYVDQLKAKTTVRVTLEPPRQKVAIAGSPARGPAAAPVEVVEFSDFQCPFCLRAYPTVNQVLSTYGDRIHFVYRHYPLPNHPNARPAAEASQCAAEQGQFWQYYERLFADQTKLSDEGLKQAAAKLGMDTARFNACVDTHKYKDRVETDIKEGNEAGVNGTPAFFINGRMLSGAQPFEAFKGIIDEELAARRQ